MNMVLFWFRRDIRLEDNAGLFEAAKAAEAAGVPLQCLFIFDSEILGKLEDPSDLRVNFIYQAVSALKLQLQKLNADLWVLKGKPFQVFSQLAATENVTAVYANHDYEPYASERDQQITEILGRAGIPFLTYKDQVIFEKDDILTAAGSTYTVFTPYKNKWLQSLTANSFKAFPSEKKLSVLAKVEPQPMLTLKEIGFRESKFQFPSSKISTAVVKNYAKNRDFPELADGTTRLGVHLRFGTISIRKVAKLAKEYSEIWLSELIWREFFMQVLWHNPRVAKESFRPEFDQIKWRNDKKEFQAWCQGKTGYPFVDAGMRELNATGFMHNRARMITASFLCKHLLTHWTWGERYFAQKLLDYELAANNGNWQWSAGTGCDASPYFRIFNPETQSKKFDPDEAYIKRWIPELKTNEYPQPIVEINFGRGRALQAYGVVKNKKIVSAGKSKKRKGLK